MTFHVPFLTRLTEIAAVQETTPGTPMPLSNADLLWNAYDFTITKPIPFTDRPMQGTLEHLPSIPGQQMAEVKFSLEVVGQGSSSNGGVPPMATTFFPACGLVQSDNVFTVDSNPANWEYLTIGYYQSGGLETITGVQLNVVFEFVNGKIGYAHFSGKGVYVGNTDTALLEGSALPSLIPPKVQGTTVVLGSYGYVYMEKLVIDLGNVVVHRQNLGSTTGLITGQVTDRRVIGSMNPERTLVSVEDPINDMLSINELTFSATIGDTDYNVIEFAGPKLQWIQSNWGNRTGIATNELNFQLSADQTGDNVLPYNNSLQITFNAGS